MTEGMQVFLLISGFVIFLSNLGWAIHIACEYDGADLNKKQKSAVIFISGPLGWVCWPPGLLIYIIAKKLNNLGSWIIEELR